MSQQIKKKFNILLAEMNQPIWKKERKATHEFSYNHERYKTFQITGFQQRGPA